MDTPLMHTVIDNLTGDCFPRLMTDLVSVCFLMFGIYLPNNNRNREYLFTFLMFNVAIFHIALLLNKTEMSLGAAFGLFAVFGLLRYRTEDIPMKEMTYLFVSIALGLVTAVSRGRFEAAGVSAVLLAATFLLDSGLVSRKELHKDLRYERIEMIKPENRAELLDDLRSRTGLDIHFVAIQSIDFVRDIANLRVFYHEQQVTICKESSNYTNS